MVSTAKSIDNHSSFTSESKSITTSSILASPISNTVSHHPNTYIGGQYNRQYNIIPTSSTSTITISGEQEQLESFGPINETNSSTPNTTGNSTVLSEQISILFPKCRPRTDVNLNPMNPNHKIGAMASTPTSSLSSSESSATTKSPNTHPTLGNLAGYGKSNQSIPSTSTIGSMIHSTIPTNPFINRHHSTNDKVSYYFNNQSTGMSGSLSTIPTTTINSLLNSHLQQMPVSGSVPMTGNHQSYMINETGGCYTNPNPFKENHHWEMKLHRTPNTTPASTVLNSPDLTEVDPRMGYPSKQGHHIRVGRSPVNHNVDGISGYTGNGGEMIDTPNKSMAVVADGEVVVFDDIEDNWQNLRITPEDRSCDHQYEPTENSYYGILSSGGNVSNKYSRSYMEQPGNRTGGRSMTGIMEYDGSPRRFGQGQNTDDNYPIHSNTKNTSSMYGTPRPGFPQRVLITPHEPIVHSSIHSYGNSSVQMTATDDTYNDASEIGTSSEITISEQPPRDSTFDYLYEFSETRKVLEEFFKCPTNDEKPLENGSDVDSIDIHYEFKGNIETDFAKYIGQKLASSPFEEYRSNSPHTTNPTNGWLDNNGVCEGLSDEQHDDGQHIMQHGPSTIHEMRSDQKDVDYFLDSASRSSAEVLDNDGRGQTITRNDSRCFRYSPETTDYDSNCGDLDSLSGDYNGTNTIYPTNYSKYYASMPILEDGLSSGHASDTENNNPSGISVVMDMKRNQSDELLPTPTAHPTVTIPSNDIIIDGTYIDQDDILHRSDDYLMINEEELNEQNQCHLDERDNVIVQSPKNKIFKNIDPELDSLYSISMIQLTPPPPAPAPHRKPSIIPIAAPDVQAALMDIKSTLQRTKALTTSMSQEKRMAPDHASSPIQESPIWIPRRVDSCAENCESEGITKIVSGDEEEQDTDLETDRLLGHQRLEDHGYFEEKTWCDRKSRSLLSKLSPKLQPGLNLNVSTGTCGITNSNSTTSIGHAISTNQNSVVNSTGLIGANNSVINVSGNAATNNSVILGNSMRQNSNTLLPTTPEVTVKSSTSKLLDIGGSMSSPDHSDKSPDKMQEMPVNDQSPTGSNKSEGEEADKKKKSKNKEVLIEGVLFRARYLGSTQLVCEGQPTKSTRMMQAEEAVSRIKAPDGEVQPSTDVDLFISTEKIMVLNTDLKEIMMDHALRTISYIADIGDLVVLMARRRFVPNEIEDGPKPNRTPKMICHVFESDEAQFIAQSIGQAFQVAYMEFLKANGIEDHSFVKEMDYQEVLNSQEIFGDELEIFAKKELQKEVVVPKAKGEILGVVIVESGWGSMLPTVVIANLLSSGAAARCGQLNIGDQIIAINGMSLVGLPLSTCQNYIKNTKTQTVVKFTVVPCAPVVEVKIKRPNTKYQLGFSVQNGVICSLLRGGIAERGGVRVGHRIIEINNQSVVAVPHEKIVNLLATSVGEILMKTMPTSMFRLLTGQENPIYI